MNILKSITTYLNGRNMRFLALVMAGIFFFSDVAFADNATTTGIENTDAGRFINDLVGILVRGGAAFLAALTSLVSYFLQPSWVNGELFRLSSILKDLWIMVSNVVYLIFAFILIAIAFMNIIGKGEGTWELKQALPKFFIGVLMVPFSWFFVQLVISITSVLTVSVLTLPFTSFTATTNDIIAGLDSEENKICMHNIIYLGGKRSAAEREGIAFTGSDSESVYECAPGQEKTLGEVLNDVFVEGEDSDSIYGIVNLYTYGVLELNQIEKLAQEDISIIGGINEVLDLGFSLIFDLIFMVIFIVLLGALFIALFVRGILLWLYMVFSPVFGLLHFLGDKAPSDKFSVKEFISLALVPVYVAGALSFGLLFLLIAGQSDTLNNPSGAGECGEDVFCIGTFKVELKGNIDSNKQKLGVDAVLGKLIIKIFGLVVLWLGVMAALKSNTITAQVTAPIEQFGNQVGSFVAKAPAYIPFVPTGGGEKISLSGIDRAFQTVKSEIKGSAAEKGQRFGEKISGGSSDVSKVNTALVRMGDIKGGPDPKFYTELKNALVAANGNANALYNSDLRKSLQGMDEDLKDKYGIKGMNLSNRNEFAQAIEKIIDKGIISGIGGADKIGGKNTIQGKEIHDMKGLEEFLKSLGTSGTESGKQNATADKTIAINISKHVIHDKDNIEGGSIVKDSSGTKSNAIVNISDDIINNNKSGNITEDALRDELKKTISSRETQETDIDSIIADIKSQKSDFFKQKSDTSKDPVEE